MAPKPSRYWSDTLFQAGYRYARKRLGGVVMVRNVDPDVRGRVLALPPHVGQNSLLNLDQQVDQAAQSRPEAIVLDLQQLQTIDSASLNWLLAVQNRLAGQGISLLIQHPSSVATDIFTATRLDHRFKFIAETGGEVRNA